MATSRVDRSSDDDVRERAYYLWEQDGKPFGRDNEYWQRALEASVAKPKRAKAAEDGEPKKPATKPGRATKVKSGPVEAARKRPAAAKVKPVKPKAKKM